MWFGILIIALLYILDQASKLIIEFALANNEVINLIPDFFYITRTYNTGAAWSFMNDSTWLLAIVSFVATIVMAYFFTKADFKKKKLYSYSLAMCIAGCFGNFVDRFMYCFNIRDGVVDFIGVYIFGYSFPVFNIADICLTVGMILLAIDVVILDEKRKNKNAAIDN